MRRKFAGEKTDHQDLKEEAEVLTQKDKYERKFDFKPFILAIGLRIVAHVFLFDYLIKSPEFTTPWNSVERLKEAVHIVNEYGISAYKGDTFHLMPVILRVLGPFTSFPLLYHGIFIGLDILSGVLFKKLSRTYLRKKEIEKRITEPDVENYSNLVFWMYLFNPMSIGTSAVGSISTLSNFGVIFFMYCLLSRKVYMAAVLMVILVFIYPYYIVLISPLLIAANSRKLTTMSVVFASTGSAFAVNCLMENARNWLPNTFYFFWSIKDLTPNVGLFWYLFVFIFEQYRQLFQWCFQLVSVVSMIPLTMTLRQDPILLTFGALAHVAILSTYPSYAEATVLLAMYPIFPHIISYTRNTLISFGAIVAALVLSPIMWRMWMVTGSGNANFYFAITIVYTFALNFMATDVFYGLSRMSFVEVCKEEGLKKTEKIPLGFKGVTPFITDPAKLVS
ncbi:hypothetical protein FO519_002187 [Halicephalobus sp. NKZ332]|nr:hypothetical protein FO519_002187 [Halicephalobus sp. NKZ332]